MIVRNLCLLNTNNTLMPFHKALISNICVQLFPPLIPSTEVGYIYN